MIQINTILGHSNDSKFENILHDLSHQNKVEYIILDHANLQRRRFRTTTNKGTDCAISISRTSKLSNGAILLLEDDRAIVVKMDEDQWLSFKPKDVAAAIELGYFAGNMHWRVRFNHDRLDVALEGPAQNYLDRLQDFISSKKIKQVKND